MCRVLYPVEHGGLSGAPVYAAAYDEAYLVEQTGLHESGVDAAASYDGKAFHAELRMQQLHGPWQVDAVSAAGYPRYTLRRKAIVIFAGARLASYHNEVFLGHVVAPEQCAVGVNGHFMFTAYARLVPCLAAYRRRVGSLNVPGSAVCICIVTRPERLASHFSSSRAL